MNFNSNSAERDFHEWEELLLASDETSFVGTA